MCLVSIKLFIFRTILCVTAQTCTTYTTLTTRSLLLSAYNEELQPRRSLYTQRVFTQD